MTKSLFDDFWSRLTFERHVEYLVTGNVEVDVEMHHIFEASNNDNEYIPLPSYLRCWSQKEREARVDLLRKSRSSYPTRSI